MQDLTPSNWTAEKLRSHKLSERLTLCPYFLKESVKNARLELNVNRVWVIGSRARGDADTFSDYDIVFDVPDKNKEQWAKFVGNQRENARTLLSIDWILLSSASEGLKKKITEEGVLIYERLDAEAGKL